MEYDEEPNEKEAIGVGLAILNGEDKSMLRKGLTKGVGYGQETLHRVP